jgi:UDP-3-O-[3-hydroxymyristoyl] glucosamine N-acyltransferase
VTEGNVYVGVAVTVGEGVMVGVKVRVGVRVSVAVGVNVGVKVEVGVGVFVHDAAVAVMAVEVRVACSSGEGPQAERMNKVMSNNKRMVFI